MTFRSVREVGKRREISAGGGEEQGAQCGRWEGVERSVREVGGSREISAGGGEE